MKNLMVCNNANKALKLNESESTGGRYILEGLFAGPFGVENRNKRIYQVDEYLKHLQYLRDDIKNGEPLLGELDHPDDRFEVKMKEVSHRILDLWYDKASNTIQGKLELLNTPNGKLAQSLVDQGIPLHISSRAAGSVNSDKSVSIQQIYTFDLVCKPGFAGAVLHRVNESESQKEYTEDVKKFLVESEKSESMNAAPQFGMVNEDVTITEVASEVKLREEAKEITENNNTDDMIEKTNVVSEEEMQQNECDQNQKENISETDDKDTDNTNADDNTDDNEENKDENTDDNSSDSDDEKEGEGVEIISVRADTGSDDEDDENKDDVNIEDVKSDSDSDDNNDSSDDSEKSDDENSDDNEEDKKDESEEADECKGSECNDTDEKKVTDLDDKEKEMLCDCDELKDRKEKFEDKLDSLIDAIKSKSEKKEANESNTINKYPISSLLNESNFAGFMDLNESQKNNVITYLQDHNMMTIESVNENWKNGIDYNVEEEVWLKYAPADYRKLYENASESVKESIKTTASFLLFENQYDVNRFWENTGLAYSESRNVLNENFINNMPKIVTQPETNELPYGNDFIKAVTEMACEYN
jgi:hypothetical protein